MTEQVKNFLLKNCNEFEKKDYKNYLLGDHTKDSWIEKSLIQRDFIILRRPICNKCNTPININEKGECLCNNNHNCVNIILSIIK